MDIPKKIKIFAKEIDVVFDNERLKKENDIWGRWSPSEAKIILRDDLPEHEVKATFLHEVFHIILLESGHIKFGRNEGLCDLLANGVMQILKL